VRPINTFHATCTLCVPRYGPHALYVQQSDACHFNGKGLAGKQAARDRTIPPEHLIPVYEAGVRHLIQTIQASYEVKESAIKNVLSM
jgi:hypothetical protein